MPVTTKHTLALLGVIIATGGSLNQCARDLGREWARSNPPPGMNVQEGFGPVSARHLGTRDDGGNDYELSVEATRPRNWGQAFAVLNASDRCGEGRSYLLLSSQPETENQDQSIELPAGTRFVQRVACEGRLPNEIAWTADMDANAAWDAASRHFQPAVLAAGEGVHPQFHVSLAPFFDRYGLRKYEAFNAALGAAMRRRQAACGGPVTLVDAVTVVAPMTEGKANPNGTLIVGTHIECAAAAP